MQLILLTQPLKNCNIDELQQVQLFHLLYFFCFHHCKQQISLPSLLWNSIRRCAKSHGLLRCLLIQVWFPTGTSAPEGRHPVFPVFPSEQLNYKLGFLRLADASREKSLHAPVICFLFGVPSLFYFIILVGHTHMDAST